MTSVNDQITDSVTQVNTLVTGNAAPQSMGMLDITGAETLGMSMFNAITAQQNSQTSSSAAATATFARILQAKAPVVAPVKKGKLKLELELTKIELAEQKAAVALLLSVSYKSHKKDDTSLSLDDFLQKLKADMETINTSVTPPIPADLLDGAIDVLLADISELNTA